MGGLTQNFVAATYHKTHNMLNKEYVQPTDKLGEAIAHLMAQNLKITDVSAAIGYDKFKFYNILRLKNTVRRKEMLEKIILAYGDYFSNGQVPEAEPTAMSSPLPIVDAGLMNKYILMLEKENERLVNQNDVLLKQVLELLKR